jgi:integrase
LSNSIRSRMSRNRASNSNGRVLTDDEIRALWATCEALPAEMAAFWKLRLITGQRVGEVNTMCWQDVGWIAAGGRFPQLRARTNWPTGHR